jgi:ribosomal protein S12 methylthiotransferase
MVDDVPETVKQERLERIGELQRLITGDRFEQRVGRTVRAIVDRVSDDTIEARTIWQAPEIDGITQVTADDAPLVVPGTLLDVRVDSVIDDYDLQATVVGTVGQMAHTAEHRSRRHLPIATSMASSYGR